MGDPGRMAGHIRHRRDGEPRRRLMTNGRVTVTTRVWAEGRSAGEVWVRGWVGRRRYARRRPLRRQTRRLQSLAGGRGVSRFDVRTPRLPGGAPMGN